MRPCWLPELDRELDELSAAIAAGESDKEIWTPSSPNTGPVVLAAPTTQGFDLVAWIAPFAVFAAALLGTILLVRRWSVGRTPGRSRARPCNFGSGRTGAPGKDSPGNRAGNDGGF